jgi:hypothetical protein
VEIVYVLSNPAMPGLVKIGKTSQEDPNGRISQLYTTGVPVPFTIEFACRAENADEVEKALHAAFAPNRINPKREFFRIDPEQAIVILKLLDAGDATNEIRSQENAIDPESQAAAEQLSRRRPNLNFLEMNIPIGSQLFFLGSEQSEPVFVTVVGPRKVRLNDGELSLTAATRQVLGSEYSVQPSPYWSYQGRSLKDIYEETYSDEV